MVIFTYNEISDWARIYSVELRLVWMLKHSSGFFFYLKYDYSQIYTSLMYLCRVWINELWLDYYVIRYRLISIHFSLIICSKTGLILFFFFFTERRLVMNLCLKWNQKKYMNEIRVIKRKKKFLLFYRIY